MVWSPPDRTEKPDPGPLRKLSVKEAQGIISRGGILVGREVISVDGYAMGWLTYLQIASMRKKAMP
jgi:hypothetical protein